MLKILQASLQQYVNQELPDVQVAFRIGRGTRNQTAIQLHPLHLLARLRSKSFKLGFSTMWTKNFQMCKLDLAKEEEPEITLPASIGS